MQFSSVKSDPAEDAFAVSAQKLAKQLLKADNNQRIEVLNLRGSAARNLDRAFEEWYAQSKQTKCLKYLYSVSIIPDPAQPGISGEQYFDLIERIEKKLGLSNQPRAVVRHVYRDGREHWHTVWSRINAGKGVAVNFSHDWRKLRRVAQEFASDYGIAFPPDLLTRFHDRADAEA
jgi:relaxase-like protein